MQVNHYDAAYVPRPVDLPSPDAVRKALNVAGTELMAMRAAPPAPDYTGPVLFEPRAAGALLAEVLAPSLSGARPPLAFQPVVEQLMSRPRRPQRLERQGRHARSSRGCHASR